MRTVVAVLFVVFCTMIVVSNFLPPPLRVPQLSLEERVASPRDNLSDLAEAGRRVYAGQCADCHGVAGTGGTAPRLDRMGFSLAPGRARDLHDILDVPIPAHAGLPAGLRGPGGQKRFNDVERLGKYLREIRQSRRRRAGD